MLVDDLMTTPVSTCRADAPLREAARIMWEADCGAVPVIGEDGRLCGMVTDRDLCMACYMTGGCMDALYVRDAMAKKTYACRDSDDMRIPLVVMRRAQVRRVPVVDADDRPVGIVSIGDLARVSRLPGAIGVVPDGESVISVLADICEPRAEMMPV